MFIAPINTVISNAIFIDKECLPHPMHIGCLWRKTSHVLVGGSNM